MSITDELRRYISGPAKSGISHICEKAIANIADRIDAEHQKALDEWKAKHGQMWLKGYAECHAELLEGNETLASDLESCGWIPLPKDADGEYIHVGDMMERGEARGHVIALMLSNCPKKWGGGLHWGVQLEGEQAPTVLDLTFHHYHAPTVEDVLREFADLVRNEQVERAQISEETVAEFAAKLRLAGDAS